MDKTLKNIAIYVLIVLLALFAIKFTSNTDEKQTKLSYPDFNSQVQEGKVKSVALR